MWHAIIVLQSASLITSAIQQPSSNTKPRDPLRLQIGEAPPHHRGLYSSLSWNIQTWKKLPILIDFIKKKLGPLDKKLKCNMFGNWSISTRGLLPSKKNNEFQKIHTFYKKLPLLLNLTQFCIPSNNSNLKYELL